MEFHPHVLRIATLPIASLLLVIAAGGHPAYANPPQGESEAERYVLETIQAGGGASLDRFPEDKRKLSESFIVKLLTKRDVKLKVASQVITISYAVLPDLDLSNQEIPYDVDFQDCIFEGVVDLSGTHFAKRLSFGQSKFKGVFDMSRATIDSGLFADYCEFSDDAVFEGVRVGQDFQIENCTLQNTFTIFASTRVGGGFSADKSKFYSRDVSFDDMRIDGDFSVQRCTFRYDQASPKGAKASRVGFVGAHFTDALLNDSSFDKIETIDFSRMQADLISFDRIQFKTPSEISLQGMTFKRLSPMNVEQLQFLLSGHDPEFHANLQTWFRNHGSPEVADQIFFADKRHERSERCRDVFRQCDRVGWAWSWTLDLLTGYGRRLDRLLAFGVIFLIIGCFVFRKKDGMEIKNKKDFADYRGSYHPFWYSLDLFLPVIRLGEAEIWTPKYERRLAILYKRVLMIVGGLIIPIALGALISK